MAQEQPQRPREDFRPQEPIKYGDVFNVSGELAGKPVAPRDAATVQAAESMVLGKTLKGGPASVMQSAADVNVRAGVLSPDSVSDVAREQGVSFAQSEDRGNRVITESIGGQVVGQYVAPAVPVARTGGTTSRETITIREALEATALSAGDKPVSRKDAAAIQAAETRATGAGRTLAKGVAAKAQAAATTNERTILEEAKVTLSDVLSDATEKLPGDKVVTTNDAEAVTGAELRNNPDMKTTPGGVAESVSAAARLNRDR